MAQKSWHWSRISVAAALLILSTAQANAAGFIQWRWSHAGLGLGTGAGVTEVAAGGEPAMAYALVDGQGIFRSSDMGQTWAHLDGDAIPLKIPHDISVSPADGNEILAGVSVDGAGLWRSMDGGKTWARAGSQASGMASDNVEAVTFYRNDPKLILVGQREGSSISVSKDGGKTWAATSMGAAVKDQIPFVIDDNHWAVASRSDGGIHYTENAGVTWAEAQGPTGYFPGPLPVVQTGTYLFSSQHHGFNRSIDSGKTWQFVMEQHTRVVGVAGQDVFRENREAIRGTDDRIFTLEMSEDYGQSWADVTAGLQTAVPDDLRSNLIISYKVDPYSLVRRATAWTSTPDDQYVFLGLGKAGLYRGRLMWSNLGPRVPLATVQPVAIVEGDTATKVHIQAWASARSGGMKQVLADLSSLGGGELTLYDDGNHDDGAPDDKEFGNSFTVPQRALAGDRFLGIIAEDDKGNINSTSVKLQISAPTAQMMLWDGDQYTGGLSWVSPTTPFNSIKPEIDDVHDGKVALELHGEGHGDISGGWNWHGWYPANSGNDIRGYRNLVFWIKVTGDQKPSSVSVKLGCSGSKSYSTSVSVGDYVSNLMDGQWHQAVIPLLDLEQGATGFDPVSTWELGVDTWTPTTANFSVYFDDIGVNNEMARPHSVLVTLPEDRQPTPVGANAVAVTASVDTRAAGTPISPYIYGAAMADRKAALEMGLTVLRAGGNEISALNWRHGFTSSGADWYYANQGQETEPQNNWLLTFFGENKKVGLETYLTMPTMGRVAKDGTSSAFDIKKYPGQESWAGKVQPTDPHPDAGNGRQYVRDAQGKLVNDKDGKPVLKDIVPDPDDTSVIMSPEDQTQMLDFMIHNMHYGASDEGGLKYLALDNEPTLWSSTHRGMHPKPVGYDELWDNTRTYASLVKKIDPGIKVAALTAWGWTAYFYSGIDQAAATENKASWADPPDYAAHGQVPLTRWILQKLRAYQEQTGKRLVDILDFHFYPQTGIYQAGEPGDPRTMEARVQETRVLWDPTWTDPSWMAGDPNGKRVDGHLQIIRMMKKWIAEDDPGLMTSLGEYNFGGEGDVSGGVAEAELLGVFAREGLDFGFYWFAPAPNSSPYFAFKMYRNPDGQHTAFGDRYLPGAVSAPNDVSVHAARDSKTGRLTFILVNKRASLGAHLTLNLAAPVPAQDITVYEYSGVDKGVIGRWPARHVDGSVIKIDLAPMSVLRFDVKP
jgi:photosystem II stability/assembly factor-like uncharacterized protein